MNVDRKFHHCQFGLPVYRNMMNFEEAYLKTENLYDANFVVTGGILHVGHHDHDLQCHQWLLSGLHDTLSFQWSLIFNIFTRG